MSSTQAMSPELSQRLAAAVDGMPAFPKSVQRILELTRDVNSTPKDLVDVIDKDPVVTVKILKVVNSAYYIHWARRGVFGLQHYQKFGVEHCCHRHAAQRQCIRF
jgi:HD-like signal output (HDOD) protein